MAASTATADRSARRTLAVLAALALVLVTSACSSSDDSSSPGDPSAADPTTTSATRDTDSTGDGASPGAATTSPSAVVPETTIPAPPMIELASETEVDGAYRQGLARVDDGWLFSTNQGLYVVDEGLTRTTINEAPIPADLLADGYDHLGDVDVDLDEGVVYAPLEQGDYERDEQLIARYDLASLELLGTTPVVQAHLAWVSVADGVVYSMSGFTDDTVLRYDQQTLEPLEPLALSDEVERVQGGDVHAGVLWLSTDEDEGDGRGDGIYHVDLATGTVTRVGQLAHSDGEGEGIDATPTDEGIVHATSIDPEWTPVWFQHFAATDA